MNDQVMAPVLGSLQTALKEAHVPYRASPAAVLRVMELLSSYDYADHVPISDFTFIHGSPGNSDHVDRCVLDHNVARLKSGRTKALLINGLTDQQCLDAGKGTRIAYPGSNTWGAYLDSIGAPFDSLGASVHTALESRKVIAHAVTCGYKVVTISTWRHHVIRCLAQIIWLMKQEGIQLFVYVTSPADFPWEENVEKGVLGGIPFSGVLLDKHIDEEVMRMEMYANEWDSRKPDGSEKFTPNATYEEVVAYLRWRNAQALPT